MHICFFACFHVLFLSLDVKGKLPSGPCSSEAVGIAHNYGIICSARIGVDEHTNKQAVEASWDGQLAKAF